MNDREAFEAWGDRHGIPESQRDWSRMAWLACAALASERAKQSAATNVGIDWANPATLNGVLCHAAPDCDCTMAELMSGHKLECPLGPPEVDPMDVAPPAAPTFKLAGKADFHMSAEFDLPIGTDLYYAAPPAAQAEPVLLNLALRLRLARRCLKQAISSGANQSYIDQLRGAETEAWNSFQAAKAIAAPPAVQGEPVAFVITDEKINFLQVNSIKRFIERAKHAHFTDIYYRINGKDEVVQADWLKHLQLAAPPADDEAVRLLTEVAETVPNMSIELEQAINAYLAKAKK